MAVKGVRSLCVAVSVLSWLAFVGVKDSLAAGLLPRVDYTFMHDGAQQSLPPQSANAYLKRTNQPDAGSCLFPREAPIRWDASVREVKVLVLIEQLRPTGFCMGQDGRLLKPIIDGLLTLTQYVFSFSVATFSNAGCIVDAIRTPCGLVSNVAIDHYGNVALMRTDLYVTGTSLPHVLEQLIAGDATPWGPAATANRLVVLLGGSGPSVDDSPATLFPSPDPAWGRISHVISSNHALVYAAASDGNSERIRQFMVRHSLTGCISKTNRGTIIPPADAILGVEWRIEEDRSADGGFLVETGDSHRGSSGCGGLNGARGKSPNAIAKFDDAVGAGPYFPPAHPDPQKEVTNSVAAATPTAGKPDIAVNESDRGSVGGLGPGSTDDAKPEGRENVADESSPGGSVLNGDSSQKPRVDTSDVATTTEAKSPPSVTETAQQAASKSELSNEIGKRPSEEGSVVSGPEIAEHFENAANGEGTVGIVAMQIGRKDSWVFHEAIRSAQDNACVSASSNGSLTNVIEGIATRVLTTLKVHVAVWKREIFNLDEGGEAELVTSSSTEEVVTEEHGINSALAIGSLVAASGAVFGILLSLGHYYFALQKHAHDTAEVIECGDEQIIREEKDIVASNYSIDYAC